MHTRCNLRRRDGLSPISEPRYLGSHWPESRYWAGVKEGDPRRHAWCRVLEGRQGDEYIEENTGCQRLTVWVAPRPCPGTRWLPGAHNAGMHKKRSKTSAHIPKPTVRGRKREHPKQALLEVPPKKSTTPGQPCSASPSLVRMQMSFRYSYREIFLSAYTSRFPRHGTTEFSETYPVGSNAGYVDTLLYLYDPIWESRVGRGCSCLSPELSTGSSHPSHARSARSGADCEGPDGRVGRVGGGLRRGRRKEGNAMKGG